MVSGTGVDCDDGPTPQRILNSCHPGRHLISPMAGYETKVLGCHFESSISSSILSRLQSATPGLEASPEFILPEILWGPIVGFLSSYRSNVIFLQFGNSCLGQVLSGTIKTPKAKARAALAG